MRLQDIRTVWICPDTSQKYLPRKLHMIELLEQIGMRNCQHFKTAGTGGANRELIRATIDILNQHMDDEPVLILEDDVEWTHQIDVSIPVGADAVYLGNSRRGGSFYNGYDDGPSIVHPYNEIMIKVENMLSTHAVIYCSKRYKQDVIHRLSGILGQEHYFSDVVISRIQKYYNVYAYKRPFFYQGAKWGGHEDGTHFVFP